MEVKRGQISMHIHIADAKYLLQSQGFKVTNMKEFNLMYNIGKAKYVINMHDGIQTHKDGSKFFGIEIFSNKRKFNKRIKEYVEMGYTQTNGNTLTIS
jgi:hypothetical protein